MVKRTKSGKTKQHRGSKGSVIDAIVAAAGFGPAAEDDGVKDNVAVGGGAAEKGGHDGGDDDVSNLKQPPEELNPPPLPPPLPNNDNAEAAAEGSTIPMAVEAPNLTLPPITVVNNSNINLGITESALLAPVTLPPKKKRKQQDEFTISQKLEILKELEGPNPPKIPALAAKYNTSRTSIYRWKNDEARLNVLLRRDGKGSSKRVSRENEESGKSKVRKSYNEEYTAAEKLAVVRELKKEGGPSVKELADKVGANHRSVYRWKMNEERLAKLVEQEGKGDCKRSGRDHALHRVKEALKVFHAHHVASVAAGATTQALTGTIIAAKAKQIKDDMLAQHDATPFLTEDEVKGMKEFTASSSWGRKIVQKYGWKEESATRKKKKNKKRKKDAAADDATAPEEGTAESGADAATTYATKHEKAIAEAETFDKIASAHAKAVAEVEAAKAIPKPKSSSPQKRIPKTLTMAKKREMTKEINLLKKKLKKADKRAEELEAENRTLKLQLSATLVNVGRAAAADGNAVVLGENLANASVDASDGGLNNSQVEGATTQI